MAALVLTVLAQSLVVQDHQSCLVNCLVRFLNWCSVAVTDFLSWTRQVLYIFLIAIGVAGSICMTVGIPQ